MANSNAAVLTVTVAAAPVNSLDLGGDSGNYAGQFIVGGAAAAISSSTAITGDDPTTMTITLGGFADGDDEEITIGATAYPAATDDTGSATAGSTTFDVAFSSGVFTITKNGGGSMPKADVQTLIDGITTENAAWPFTVGARTLSISLDGGTAKVATIANYIAELPREYVDTTYSLPTGGTTWTPADATELQTALDDSELGDVIVLTAGVTYAGTFIFPEKLTGTGWIYVISSEMASLPAEGELVTPADYPHMPTLEAVNINYPAILIAPAAHHYRIAGVAVATPLANYYAAASGWDDSMVAVNDAADLPEDIIFDRCYVQSTSGTLRLRTGIGLNGHRMATVGSWVANCKDTADAQAALVGFVKECLRPTNAALATSGLGGTYIGAVPYSAPSGGGGGASINNNTDLTAFAEWQADMLSFGATYAAYLAEHKNDSAPGQSFFENELILRVYYDAERVFHNIADYTGNATWRTAAADARHLYNRWMVANGYVLPGYWKFTQGARMAWQLNNADSQAVDIINGLANFGAFSPDSVPLGSMASEALSREVAYTMNCYMDQEWIGGAHRDKLEDLLDLILDTGGHIDQWFVTGPVANFAPFMFGLTCEALIRYYHEQAQDARIIPAIALGANWIWDNAWSNTYGQFYYRLDFPDWEAGSELNLLICPLYWWLYKQTGNATYLTRGDAIFNAGIPTAFMGPFKQWNQVYRWTFAGLLWRDEGKIAWGA